MRRKILEGGDIKPEIERLIEGKVRELTPVPAKNNKKFNEEFEVVFPLDEKTLKLLVKKKKIRLALNSA